MVILQDLKISFAAETLLHSAKLLFGMASDQSTPSYRNDARQKQTQQPDGPVVPIGAWQSTKCQIDPVLMQVDLRALRDLKERHEIDLFIYESPLHSIVRFTNSIHNKIRRIFLKTCIQFDLQCISELSSNDFEANEK
ncbi:MAG: hypothetical protein ACPGQV_12020 [Alphaproteobacteria bacterium]